MAGPALAITHAWTRDGWPAPKPMILSWRPLWGGLMGAGRFFQAEDQPQRPST